MRPLRSIIAETLLGAEFINGSSLPDYADFSVDSRTLKAGEFFVALKGTQVDGHEFVKQACDRGACALLIEKAQRSVIEKFGLSKNLPIVLVDNTLQALGQIAHAWRMQFSYPVVGITGSAGKTSLRQAIENILNVANIPYVVSLANQNSLSGLPLTLLRMRDFHKVAVVEIGISKRGEMKQLAALAQPTTAVITLIGHSHMEGLGTLLEVAFEKKQIFSSFKPDNIGIVFGDQSVLAQTSYPHPVIKFGTKTINQIQARKIRCMPDGTISFTLKWYGNKEKIVLQTTHKGLVFNALAATAVGYLLNVPSKAIIQGISQPINVPGRFERVVISDSTTIINDCYNANPESMKESLAAFEKLHSNVPKVAVLGEMRELGANSAFWHRQIGRFLRKIPSVRKVVLVGPMAQWIRKTIPLSVDVTWVTDWTEAVQYIAPHVASGALIFVKASRGLTLEKLIEAVRTPGITQSVAVQPALQTTA